MEKNVEARLNEIEKRLMRIEAILAGPQHGLPAPAKIKRQSAKEFLLARNVKAETQKVLALAYFLEHVEGLTPFNVADLEAMFRQAREKLPKNMNDAVNKNIARGFLMQAREKKDSRKAWNLTATGERFVEDSMN